MRLIDADELKSRMLDYYSYSWQLHEEISDFFDNTPTVDQWIPVSKQKPSHDDYIITGKKKYDFEEEWEYFVDAAFYDQDSNWHTWNDWNEGEEIEIIAWMELPDPYRENKN